MGQKRRRGTGTTLSLCAKLDLPSYIFARIKYPSAKYDIFWLFDQSSGHTAMAADALVAARMNVSNGGAQPRMRDTIMPGGRVQKMTTDGGEAKGLKTVLTERGINCSTLKKDDMIKILSQHDDFRDEKTIVESYLLAKGHLVMFFPKFHCELNSIERVWAQAKRYTRGHCNYTFNGLLHTVGPALDSVDTVLIRKYFRKSH